jgi:hypothetical protein
MKYRKMRWHTWVRTFRPIQNPFDSHRGDDGLMFETFGEELAFVRSQDPDSIWTLLDCDSNLIVANGYHFVNRLGYYVTQVPCPRDQQIDVT